MIVCSHCESAQWLQIVSSTIRLRRDGSGETHVMESSEDMECTLCGSEGSVIYTGGDRITHGDVETDTDTPRVTV